MIRRLLAALAAALYRPLLRRPLARRRIAWQYLRGEGIEVGALDDPLPTPPWARVRYVDRLSTVDLAKHYPESSGRLVPVDVVANGERLEGLADGSQDFVIANQFIEHCQDPMGAIASFLRVLKADGVLFLSIPDKRFTFDEPRPVTTLEHLLRDHREGPDWSRRHHYEDWAEHVGGKNTAEEISAEADRLMEMDYSIHFHVWTQTEMLELMSVLRRDLALRFDVEAALRTRDESLFLLRKH